MCSPWGVKGILMTLYQCELIKLFFRVSVQTMKPEILQKISPLLCQTCWRFSHNGFTWQSSEKLAVLIKNLPTSPPCTTKDSPITKFFTSHEYHYDKGPYYTFNKSWGCVFQVSDDEKGKLVLRGKHGLPLILMYLLHFSKIPEIALFSPAFISLFTYIYQHSLIVIVITISIARLCCPPFYLLLSTHLLNPSFYTNTSNITGVPSIFLLHSHNYTKSHITFMVAQLVPFHNYGQLHSIQSHPILLHPILFQIHLICQSVYPPCWLNTHWHSIINEI